MLDQITSTRYQGQYKDAALQDLSEFWVNIGNEYDTWNDARTRGVYLCDRLIEAGPELPLSFRVLKTQTVVNLELEYNPDDRDKEWKFIE